MCTYHFNNRFLLLTLKMYISLIHNERCVIIGNVDKYSFPIWICVSKIGVFYLRLKCHDNIDQITYRKRRIFDAIYNTVKYYSDC